MSGASGEQPRGAAAAVGARPSATRSAAATTRDDGATAPTRSDPDHCTRPSLLRLRVTAATPDGAHPTTRSDSRCDRRGRRSAISSRTSSIVAAPLHGGLERARARRAARRTTGRTCAGSGSPGRGPCARRRARSPSRARRGSPRGRAGRSERPSSSANSHGFPSEPRASSTASAPVCSNAARAFSAVCRPPETSTGTGSSSTSSTHELVAGSPVWRWVAWRGCRHRPATPPSWTSRRATSTPADVPGAQTRAQLDRHRQPAAAARGLDERDRPVGIVEQRRPGAGLADLRDRAAHVDVDQVRAGRRDLLGGRGHHVRIGAEQLHGDRPARPLIRVDAQQLPARALVAVVDRERGDHLRHREAGAVAFGLQADEPVADSGERRQRHAIGDRDAAEGPTVGECASHRTIHGTNEGWTSPRCSPRGPRSCVTRSRGSNYSTSTPTSGRTTRTA